MQEKGGETNGNRVLKTKQGPIPESISVCSPRQEIKVLNCWLAVVAVIDHGSWSQLNNTLIHWSEGTV